MHVHAHADNSNVDTTEWSEDPHLPRLYNKIFDGPGRMDLVGNHKADRFSRCVEMALKTTKCMSVCSFFNFCNLNIFKI